ncbi:GGDEF domain-containing protein [Aquincola tertiaricarbonis]|uniref:GGDEF domain-containing protein n=1 Tax=Aquincola tertiaricarbonis TaxID=391953 RepID=UPI0012EDC0D5|nr:GGDEF domain-containing protein [Aquincola tertiaricarbonis]
MALRRRLLALVLAALGAAPAAATPAAFEAQVDQLQRSGYEHPDAALAGLQQLRRQASTPEALRLVLQALGSIQAQAGRSRDAEATAELLLELAQQPAPREQAGRALAGSNLVRAQVAENGGQSAMAAALAQAALQVFEADCPPHTERPLHCDYRAAWSARQIVQRRAVGQGVAATQAAHARAALALAEAGGDARRQATSLGALAVLAEEAGDGEEARRLIARARRLVLPLDDMGELARLSDIEARLAGIRGDQRHALHHHQQAQLMAARADAPRLEARMLTNLSDAYVHAQRPADALAAAEKALLIIRQRHDLRAERAAVNNAGLAKIGLGRLAEGKEDLARLIALWEAGGDTGRQAETLREFGEALAAAGDARAAIDLFHRERALSAELMRINRSAALKELQARNDAEARQRDIDLLARDNALKTEALANRALQQRIGWLLAAVMLAATAAALLLYRRVRSTHRELAASQVRLQAQSERDPLTQLSNRRHFQAAMARLAAPDGSFHGGLLLVDIDHFKRINDVQGHAAGDEVLVEVARRLQAAAGPADLVVRWGGEEFLLVRPGADAAAVQRLAQQLLAAVAGKPVVAGGQPLQLSASIGHGSFPLPPHGRPVRHEQAIALVDRALYAAKHQGRNRAVGV